MGKQQKPPKETFQIRNYTIFGVIVWTVTLVILLSWNINLIEEEALKRAYIYTKVGFDKDVLYRRWAAQHGGVYVRIDSLTPPNPYLSHIADRDIIIDSNLQLTLMNPAYITRQVYEFQEKISEVRGHITSLKPIRPENAPDPWEEQALLAFERGVKEVAEVSSIEGKDYFRFMAPFIIEESCLQCHAYQGYKLNDIRGGVSVSYPLDQVNILIDNDIRNQSLLYGLIWILGIGILSVSYRRLKKSDHRRLAAEDSLLVLNSQLEEVVKERTFELQKTNEDLQTEMDQRKSFEDALRVSEKRFRGLMEQAGDALFLSDFEGNILEVNNRSCQTSGYSREELLSMKVRDLDSEFVTLEQQRAFWNSLNPGKTTTLKTTHKRKDGSLYPVEISVGLIEVDNNRAVLGFVRDITERNQAEEELIIEKEFTEKIIETSTAIIVGLDKNHFIQIFNAGAETITGYNKKEVIGKDWFEMFFPKELIEKMNNVWEKAWGAPAHSYINPILAKNGKEKIISWQSTGIYEGEDSSKHLLISIGEDITGRSQTEAELEKHRNHLEELVKERTLELENKNKTLARMNQLFIGRELRMKELKDEIENLKGSSTDSM